MSAAGVAAGVQVQAARLGSSTFLSFCDRAPRQRQHALHSGGNRLWWCYRAQGLVVAPPWPWPPPWPPPPPPLPPPWTSTSSSQFYFYQPQNVATPWPNKNNVAVGFQHYGRASTTAATTGSGWKEAALRQCFGVQPFAAAGAWLATPTGRRWRRTGQTP